MAEEAVNTQRLKDERSLRWASDHLCLWRVCASAACRHARCCRGRANTCAARNYHILPQGVRDWFGFVLAAKLAEVSFEAFKAEMDGRKETKAYFAWRRAAHAKPRRGHGLRGNIATMKGGRHVS